MAFTNPFGPPTDPKYVRFKDGIDNWVLGKPAVLELRWSPWEDNGTWRRYPRTKFTHVDFGQPPGPSSPLELKFNFGGDYKYESRVSTFEWPRIFREVETRYASFSYSHPQAVWNIYDGSWRKVIYGANTGQDSAEGDLRKKIAKIKNLEATGVITNEQAQRRIDQLLQEYI